MRKIFMAFLCLLVCTGTAWSQGTDTNQSTQDKDTVTISRTEFEDLKSAVASLKAEVEELKGKPTPAQSTASSEKKSDEDIPAPPEVSAPPALDATAPVQAAPALPEAVTSEAAPPNVTTPEASAPEETSSESTTSAPASGGGKSLALPDISLVVQAKGHLSSDKHDDGKDRLQVNEAELSVQGYVYPNVKADAFLTTSPQEKSSMSVEEAYLTYISAAKGLNIYLGEKHVPFGRTNLVHSHSWQYVNQPLVLRNLVASESLGGQGVDASYLIPTKSKLFAQLDLGTWTGDGPGESSNLPDVVVGSGAAFADKFNTARLWTGYPINDYNEVELGGSYANGASDGQAIPGHGQTKLSGLDLSYRHFGEGDSRLLLRTEGVWRHESVDTLSSTASGYYLFGNYRWNKYSSIGVLYDWSEFPQSPDLHESALSLIATKQLSEQYYIRLQGTHGSRPDDPSYNELWLQWVWGVGPHTHNLE